MSNWFEKNYVVIRLDDVEKYAFDDIEPNEHGVFMRPVMVSVIPDKGEGDWFYVTIAKHAGRYYVGHHFEVDGTGGCFGPATGNEFYTQPSYPNASDAVEHELKEWLEHGGKAGEVIKPVYDSHYRNRQLSLF